MAKSKLAQANEKIAADVVKGYQKIEDSVVGGYQKIESGVVDGFTSMTDRFVERFLTREGETVQEAKARLSAEQAVREAAAQQAGQARQDPHSAKEADPSPRMAGERGEEA